MVAVRIKVGDGLRVDAVNEMIIPAKGATILARVIKSECFYEFSFISKDMLAVNDGDFNLQLPNIDDKILRETFRRESDKAAEGLVMSTAEFKQMVKGSAYVPSDSNSAQLSSLAYSTVNLKFVDGKLTMTGLARPRIAVIGREVDTVKGNFSCNVPAPALHFMAKLAEQGSDICLGYDDATKELHFSVNEWRVVSKCFTVNYPDVSKILRINSPVVAEVNRRELYNALKFCKPTIDAHKTVKHIFGRGKMVQVCSKSKDGSKATKQKPPRLLGRSFFISSGCRIIFVA